MIWTLTLHWMQSYVNDYLDYVSPVPYILSLGNDDLDLWGNTYWLYSVWVIYGLTLSDNSKASNVIFHLLCCFTDGTYPVITWRR